MRFLKWENLAFYLLLFLFVAYAIFFIYKSSFMMGGERFFVLFDDAMISMRYAKNLANGDGLVWNPGGERVEGYTNPLWVIYMSIFHLLPIASPKISLLVQLGGALFLLVNLIFVKKIASHFTSHALVPILAVLLTAIYAPLNNWGLLGMEVSALTLVASISVWLVLKNWQANSFSPWLYILLGISTLIRIDMAVMYVLVLFFQVLVDSRNRRKHIMWGLGLLFFFLTSQTLFRLWYYGTPLPNTFYLKMEGYPLLQRLNHGLYVLLLFTWRLNWFIFFLPLIILFFRRDREIFYVLLLIAGQLAYSVYVGGDAWEHKGGSNRYISIVMPLFFIVFVYALSLIRDALVGVKGIGTPQVQRIVNITMIFFVLVSLVNFNTLIDFKSIGRWMLTQNPEFVRGNQEYVRIAKDLNEFTTAEAKVAVVTAGAIPYFADRFAIDLLGKNDPVIAHALPRNTADITNLELFRPGHMKWDYDYSIGELQPDVIVQLWGEKDEATPYLMAQYKTGRIAGSGGRYYYLLADSPNILWEQMEIKP